MQQGGARGGGGGAGGGRRRRRDQGDEGAGGKLVWATDYLKVSAGNLNRTEVKKTWAEKDLELKAKLKKFPQVPTKELNSYRVHIEQQGQGEPIDGMNVEATGLVNISAYNRRQLIDLMLRNQENSQEGKTLWGMIKANMEKAEGICKKIKEKENGDPVPILKFLLETPSLLKAWGRMGLCCFSM